MYPLNHLPDPGTVSGPHTPASPLSPVDIVVEEDDDDEVKVKERELSHALSYSPALKFVTRKDLFSFLSSAGVSVWCVGCWHQISQLSTCNSTFAPFVCMYS